MLPGAGMDPRQMAMMMKRLGIDVKDIQGVQEVVVRTATRDYVFTKPAVSVMKAQGVETWQVSGTPATRDHAVQLEVSKEDVELVMKETGKSESEAKAALAATKGDLAEAILRLSQ
jgi:nascent polypeptide-associated complex subunit alpha